MYPRELLLCICRHVYMVVHFENTYSCHHTHCCHNCRLEHWTALELLVTDLSSKGAYSVFHLYPQIVDNHNQLLGGEHKCCFQATLSDHNLIGTTQQMQIKAVICRGQFLCWNFLSCLCTPDLVQGCAVWISIQNSQQTEYRQAFEFLRAIHCQDLSVLDIS